MKKWEIINKQEIKSQKLNAEEIVKILLENRGIKTKKETADFLNPKLSTVTSESVKINKVQLKKAVNRIKKAIKEKEQIIIFGDYDVDGICATAILWETFNGLKAKVMPYIPHRIDEGYGLSEKGILNLTSQIPDVKLIITVDNGIVANSAVDFAKKRGIDVIITDHHVLSKNIPKAFAIVHTTAVCGASVAYLLAKEFKTQKTKFRDPHLELVALATVADLVPLLWENRVFLKEGLLELQNTKRPGLLALFKEAKVDQKTIGVYEIGHMIAPRINAMGRLESAMDALRLICTTNHKRAEELSFKLGLTNRERQTVTLDAVLHAREKVKKIADKDNLLFISDEKYEQGVIGLVAGRLVEEFYKPSIVVSKGKVLSKASARSIAGFNIIEFIREELGLLVDVGGHPMAAGFTVETKNLLLLEKKLKKRAMDSLDKDLLKRSVKIDLELPSNLISQKLYDAILKLAPFGMKNPEPIFVSKGLIVDSFRLVGNGGKHLKIKLKTADSSLGFEGIAFGIGEEKEFKIGDRVDVVYNLSENQWNGNKSLQLKIKDIRVS